MPRARRALNVNQQWGTFCAPSGNHLQKRTAPKIEEVVHLLLPAVVRLGLLLASYNYVVLFVLEALLVLGLLLLRLYDFRMRAQSVFSSYGPLIVVLLLDEEALVGVLLGNLRSSRVACLGIDGNLGVGDVVGEVEL